MATSGMTNLRRQACDILQDEIFSYRNIGHSSSKYGLSITSLWT